MRKHLAFYMLIALPIIVLITILPVASLGINKTDGVDIGVTVVSWIEISSPPNLNLRTMLNKADTTSGIVTWKVSTNSSTGHTFYVKSTQKPAMRRIIGSNRVSFRDHFDDYRERKPSTPETWRVPRTRTAFGFSAFGPNVLGRWGKHPKLRFVGFKGQSNIKVAQSSSEILSNKISLVVRAEVGSRRTIRQGKYKATIVATALAN